MVWKRTYLSTYVVTTDNQVCMCTADQVFACIIHICVNRKRHLVCAHGNIHKIYNAVAVMRAHQAYVLLENDAIK